MKKPLLLLALLLLPAHAWAQEEEDATVVQARREFTQGTKLVRAEQWAEALASFERAAALKAHPITTFNIAQCERAMGQYTRARRSFISALAQDDALEPKALSDSARVEAKGLIAELDRILSHVTITLKPEDAALAVDGRPLEAANDANDASGANPVFVAGTLPPGPGAPPNVVKFEVVTNPGVHVFTVSRQGYQDVVVNKTLAPGAHTTLPLELDKLPAAIHITSNLADALVRVNDADVGNPPVEVSRVAGRYRVKVTKKGFDPYETEFAVRPGERIELAANLREEKRALTSKWWFWTGLGVVIVGAAAGTYAITQSNNEPTRPPTDGGGLGWSLRVH